MTIRAAFEHLQTALGSLADRLAALSTVVTQDRPSGGENSLADRLDDSISEIRGWLTESNTVLCEVQAPAGASAAALTAVHKNCNRISELFFTDIAASVSVNQLSSFARERGGEWNAWARAVLCAIGDCQVPLFDLNRAVQAAWEEFAERLPTGS